MLKSTFWNRYCYPHFTLQKTEAPRDLGTCLGSCPGPIFSLSDSEVHAEYIISRSGIRHNSLLLGPGVNHTEPLYTLLGGPGTCELSRWSTRCQDLRFSRKRAVDMQGSQAPRVGWCGHRNSSSQPARRGTAKSRGQLSCHHRERSPPPSLFHPTLKYAASQCPLLSCLLQR